MLRSDTSIRRNLLCSLSWIAVALLWAAYTPRLAFTSTSVVALGNWAPLALTFVLITWNIITAFRLFGRTGRVLSAWPLTIALLGLFTLLFFQISVHLGPGHYQWRGDVSLTSWVSFSFVRAFRAADLSDLLQAYGWQLHPIRNTSHVTSLALIAFHLLTGLFVIGLVARLVGRLMQMVFPRKPGRYGLLLYLIVCVCFLITWLMSALVLRPWQWHDMGLWLVDGLVRVVDIADVMEVYHLEFYQAPRALWEGTLTVLFRLLLVLGLGAEVAFLWNKRRDAKTR